MEDKTENVTTNHDESKDTPSVSNQLTQFYLNSHIFRYRYTLVLDTCESTQVECILSQTEGVTFELHNLN
jgi:hypothetical protein